MKLKSPTGLFFSLLLLISASYFAGGVYGVFGYLLNGTTLAKLPLDFGFLGSQILGISSEAAEVGIRRYDRLLEIGGRPFVGYTDMVEEIHKRRAGDLLPVVIHRARDGSILNLQIKLRPRLNEAVPGWTWLWKIASQIVFPSFCMLIGFWVVWNKPRDLRAWLLLAIMLASSVFLPTWTWTGYPRAFVFGWEGFLSSMLPGVMLLFAIYFPDRSQMDRNWPWLKWLLLVPLTVCSAVFIWWAVFKQINMALNDWTIPYLNDAIKSRQILSMVAFGLFFAILGQKSATASTKDARRRLQLLWVSSAIGFTPSFFVTIYSLVSGKDWGYDVPDWVLFLAILGFAVFPLTLAYVVVVHRAMDVSMVMRQSLQYALAKNGLSVLRAILVIMALTTILDPQKTVGNQAAGLALGGVALLALRGKFSDKASQWMDRKFFREAYSSEHILSHLSGEVRKYSETKPLLETVTSRISDTLHVPKIAVLLADGDNYSGGGAAFGVESKTMEYLRTADKPAVVYFDDPDSWVHQVEPQGQQTLKSLDAQLLLPLTGRDKLMGLISLGPKLSEVPYSNSDVKLLQSVASQMGLAIENNQLVSKLASEAAIQERMNRELEIAREVQQRLFPQKFPTIGGLDCCGKCRAALGVGGDYYDFLLLPDGKLGIAIGDVSGKGISAALLMASLRSSLRGQTIVGCTDLAGLMTNMNHLVYEASASNRYATFFYGQYDPTTRRLDFVNAGHNAPVILRDQQVLLLEAGGPVVGLLSRTVYKQMSIQLEPGDLFLGYTDGISEAMNKADEEWGEDQMIATTKANANLGSNDLIDQIMIHADVFADGAEQHDDMTLLVMKIAN